MNASEKEMLIERIKALKEEIAKLEAMLNESEKGAEEPVEVEEVVEELNKKTEELNDTENKLKEEINKEIEKFNSDSEKIKKQLEKIKATLILEIDVDKINVTEVINGLTEELKELEKEADVLMADIETFKSELGSEGLTLTTKEIKDRVKKFKSRLKDLKKSQIEKYNLRVEATNELVKGYKEHISAGTEEYSIINGIEELALCGATVTNWTHNSYLEQLDYNRLIEVNNILKTVEKKLEVKIDLVEDLEEELYNINVKKLEIDVLVTDDMTLEELDEAQNKMRNLLDSLLAFGNKIDDLLSQKKISEEEYKQLNAKYQLHMNDYFELLKDVGQKPLKEETEYEKISKMIDVLRENVSAFVFKMDSLYGKVVVSAQDLLNGEAKLLETQLVKVSKDIEQKYKDGIIDKNQYEVLIKKIEEMEKTQIQINVKLKSPGMYLMNEDLLGMFLNGSIDGIEKTIDALEKQLDALEKPIKDKKVRKDIDTIFKKLELEIKMLEKQLETSKNQDEEKYNETKEKLKATKKRLEVVGKKYRRKCPLLVRTVKSAKHFFKKYKKQILIIAGLVAFAMMAHSVIIPAIMHGNIMLAASVPALGGALKVINNVLGGVIGASKGINGIWMLKNGVTIGSSAAASSLLKGLAITGIGTGALLAPVVVMIKKLMEKINKVELKQKLIDGKNLVVDKVKKGANVVKEVAQEVKDELKGKTDEIREMQQEKKSSKKAKRHTKLSIMNVIQDYAKSGLTVEEYCKENDIDGVMADLLKMYDAELKKNLESLNKKKGGK